MDHQKYADVNRVIILLGPHYDIGLTWEDDPEDGEWNLTENIVDHFQVDADAGTTQCVSPYLSKRRRDVSPWTQAVDMI